MTGEKGPPQSELLVRLAETAWTVGQTLEGEPFAIDSARLPGIVWPLRGRGGSLRAQLADQYRNEHGRPPGSGALADCLAVIEGQALTAPRSDVSLRAARPAPACVVVDLGRPGSSECIVIEPGRWRLAERPPGQVMFRRTPLTGQLPLPAAPGSGDLGRLHALINISPQDQPLVDAFLVAAQLADIPHPVLALQSRQGAAKSTTASMLVRAIDPSPAPLRASPASLEEWAIAAAGSSVVALDNVSGFQHWLQDALCRAVTGEALVRRALYTDDEVHVVTFRRTVLLTGIDLGALRGDLADRSLLLQPEPIPPSRRRPEADLAADYEDAWPTITAGVYDLTAQVLEILADIDLPDPPRMADYARVVAAVDKVTGSNGLGRYADLGRRLTTDVLDADEVATAVLRLMTDLEHWEGTASDLLTQARPADPSNNWPKQANTLTGRLRRAAPALADAGLHMSDRRTSTARLIVLRRGDDVTINDGHDGQTPFLFNREGEGGEDTEGERPSSPSHRHTDDLDSVPDHVLDQWAEQDTGHEDEAA